MSDAYSSRQMTPTTTGAMVIGRISLTRIRPAKRSSRDDQQRQRRARAGLDRDASDDEHAPWSGSRRQKTWSCADDAVIVQPGEAEVAPVAGSACRLARMP